MASIVDMNGKLILLSVKVSVDGLDGFIQMGSFCIGRVCQQHFGLDQGRTQKVKGEQNSFTCP